MTRNLTPYDTGARLQPEVWVSPAVGRPAEQDHDRYGRVDFNDDENATRAIVYAEKVESCYIVHVYSTETDTEARLNLSADLDKVQARILDEPSQGGTEFQGVTPRGFGYSEFESHGNPTPLLEVQESSLATARCLWIGTGGARAHLEEEQVRKVRDLLTSWLEGATP